MAHCEHIRRISRLTKEDVMTVGHLSFGPLVPTTVGFDRFFDSVERMLQSDLQPTKFPPHNIVKQDEYHFVIEMAVAGFEEKEIDVTIKNSTLTVQGLKDTKDEDKLEYVYRGIANRSFIKTFQLADSVEVHDAKLVNGMLRIELENVVPESRKARKIPLTTSTPQLLNEQK